MIRTLTPDPTAARPGTAATLPGAGCATAPRRRQRLWRRGALLLGAALVGAVVARAETPATKAPVAAASQSDGVARTRATFDAAFAAVRARLPADASRPGHPQHDLYALLEFQRTRVGWLTMDANRFRGNENSRLRSWMTVVPKDHPFRQRMQSSLQMTAKQDFYVVFIAEADYHPAWAMLFAVHEVTHLHDRELGIEPLEPSRREFFDAELRAYRNELQVAELLSEGEFVRTLDAILDDWAPANMRAVDTRANRIDDADADRLSRTIDHAESRSPQEDGLRRGFFWIALVMRYADRTGGGDAAIREVLERRIPLSPEDAKLMK